MANLNTAISPAPQVTCFTKGGAIATGYSGTVTVALGVNPTGATLGGTLSVAATAGVATFSDLTLNRSGKDFRLSGGATGLRTTQSNAFTISTGLVFTTQPANIQPNTSFSVVVAARDGAGNTDTAYNGAVTVAIYRGTGTLSGTTTVMAVSGVATFTGLSIAEEGTFALIASGATVSTAYPPASKVSNNFQVGAFTITILSSESDLNIATRFTSIYGSIPSSITLNVTVNSGIVVSSTSTANAALTWSAGWSGSNTFNLINNGYIIGKGGDGGAGGRPDGSNPPDNGSDGGKAIELSGQVVDITNASGFIWGGGGGGGGGGAAYGEVLTAPTGSGPAPGGGGGAGAGDASGGNAGLSNPVSGDVTQLIAETDGSDSSGTLISQVGAIGGGGRLTQYNQPPNYASLGGTGGTGGNFGASGSAGGDGIQNYPGPTVVQEPGASGGGAGNAINLSGGTANFVSGSGSPNVKGAVS